LKLAFPDLCCFPKGLLGPLIILHQSVPIFLCLAAEHNIIFAFRSRDDARAYRGGNGLDDLGRLAGVYFWRLYYQLFRVFRWDGDPASGFVGFCSGDSSCGGSGLNYYIIEENQKKKKECLAS